MSGRDESKHTPLQRNERMRRIAGSAAVLLAFYLLVALAPLVLAWLQNLPPRAFRDEFSSALALIAFAMLLLEFVLSGRFNAISGQVGIDLIMRFHQLIARPATLFILVHPFLYVTPAKPRRPWDTTGQLTLGLEAESIATGFASWTILVLLTFFAIFRDQQPYRYEIWRLTHGLGAAFVAAFGAHHALAAGRYSGDTLLTAYWLGLLGVALFTILYVYVITPLLQLRHPYRVVKVERAALKTWTLAIEPLSGEAMPFEAGQFCWLTLNRTPFAITEHPFSISSCPADLPRVEFTIKQSGDFTNAIGTIPVGASAYVDGPHGGLTLAGRRGTGIAFIAGGVGVAPILSILRQLGAEGDNRPIKLLYGNRVAEQIVCREELQHMRQVLNLEVHHILSEPPADWTGMVGQLDDRVLQDLLTFDGHARWLYVVCGPAPMIESVENSLNRLGVPLKQIVSEKFSYD